MFTGAGRQTKPGPERKLHKNSLRITGEFAGYLKGIVAIFY